MPEVTVDNVKKFAQTWLALIIAVSTMVAVSLDAGAYREQVRANTTHRLSWSHIDPDDFRSLPRQLATLTEQIRSLRRDLARMEAMDKEPRQ